MPTTATDAKSIGYRVIAFRVSRDMERAIAQIAQRDGNELNLSSVVRRLVAIGLRAERERDRRG